MNNSGEKKKRERAGAGKKRNIRHLHLGVSRADDAFTFKYRNCTDCDPAVFKLDSAFNAGVEEQVKINCETMRSASH